MPKPSNAVQWSSRDQKWYLKGRDGTNPVEWSAAGLLLRGTGTLYNANIGTLAAIRGLAVAGTGSLANLNSTTATMTNINVGSLATIRAISVGGTGSIANFNAAVSTLTNINVGTLAIIRAVNVAGTGSFANANIAALVTPQINPAANLGVTVTGADRGININSAFVRPQINFTVTNTGSAAAADIISDVYVYGLDDADATITYLRQSVVTATVAAGSTYSLVRWTLMESATNEAMRLEGNGALAVDANAATGTAVLGLFDDYDDALVIQQGIQKNNRELLADIGVFERKDTGSGYMMKIQPMMRLLAGGIYQTRAKMDVLEASIADRFKLLDNRLSAIQNRLPAGN